MFRFGEPTYLYLLLLLPFLAVFYLYSNYRRRKNIRRFGDPVLLAQLMPDVSKYRPDVKFWIIFVAIGLFSVLLARPQFGSKLETVKRKGVEVIIALDISNSMLAQDVQPSRLEKAKRFIAEAEQMLSMGLWDLAANRFYYSCFHAAQALLIHYGLSAHTHAGTLGVFGMNFVKTGKIDKELGAFFSRMEQLRMKADYNCEYDVSNSDVENMLQPAHDFLNSIIKLIKEKQ